MFIQNILCSGCQLSIQRVEDNGKSQIQAYISMIFQTQSTFKLLPGMYYAQLMRHHIAKATIFVVNNTMSAFWNELLE